MLQSPLRRPRATLATTLAAIAAGGLVLVADRGERVRVDVTNSLDEPTTVHWHGTHVPAAMLVLQSKMTPEIAGLLGPVADTNGGSDAFENMGRIDETVTVDILERWVVENTTNLPHSFHVHDVQFRIAAIDGVAPPPEPAGWKDTIYTEPETEYELLMRFDDYADAATPYIYHCHLPWHEDQGMMGQFVVVEPGQSATMTGGPHHEH